MASGETYERTTSSVMMTQQLAQSLSSFLKPGDVVVLRGDLGAGKTHFVQGVAEGLGISEPVQSPTFNLLVAYEESPLPLYHFDLYRLDDQSQLEDIAYYETIDGLGVSFIEWGDKFPHALPYDYLDLKIGVDDEGRRIIRAHSVGERSQRLLTLWAKDSKSRLVKKGTPRN